MSNYGNVAQGLPYDGWPIEHGRHPPETKQI